jgi:predicted HTH transcriptional regulator
MGTAITGKSLVDLRDLTQYGSSSPWENVIDVPPDLATQVAGAIARGEGERTELKEQIPYGKDNFLNVVAAFANGEGGMIIIGVVNKTGAIKGLTCDLSDERDRLSQLIRSNVYPEPKIKIESCELKGRKLLVILVEEGQNKPYGVGTDPSKLSFYVRRTATTPPARQEEIRAMTIGANNGRAQANSYWSHRLLS